MAALGLELIVGNHNVINKTPYELMIQQPEILKDKIFISESFQEKGIDVSYDIECGSGDGYNKLSESEQNEIIIARENEKILAEVNGSEYVQKADENLVEKEDGIYRKVTRNFYTISFSKPLYVDKAQIFIPSRDKGSDCYVKATLGDQTVYELQNGYIDQRISASVLQLGKEIDGIQFQVSNFEKIAVNDVKIQLSNQFQFNGIRFCFFLITMGFIGFFVLSQKWFSLQIEKAFVVCCLFLGGILILSIGTNQVGYDEHVHFGQAYPLSFGRTVQTTESAMQMQAGTYPTFYNAKERKLIEEYAEESNDFQGANITHQGRFIKYDERSYLPISIFLKIGRILNLPFVWNMMLGKLGNLLLYTLVIYIALRLSKVGKELIAALALIPNNLFAATGITYDAIVNGFLLLAVVLTLNLIYEEREETAKLTWLQVLMVMGAYIIGSTAKPIYIIMSLMLVFLPAKRFENGWQKVVFKCAIAGIVVFMVYTIFFPPISESSNYELVGNLAYAGDKRNQGTSVLGQLSYILQNPISYAKLLLGSMVGELRKYLFDTKEFLNYGYLGGLKVGWTWLTLITISAAALVSPVGEIRHTIGKKYKILNLVMVFGVSSIIWTSMYVSFTPVASPAIIGVQGRYFIPLLLPFFVCIFNSKWKSPIPKNWYAKIILGVLVFINLYATYTLALLARSW